MITKYPEKATLKEVLSGSLSTTSLKNICKKNGIFLLSPSKETIIQDAHLFYWGFNDVNFISDQIEDEKNYKKSFRLQLEFSPDEADSSIFQRFVQPLLTIEICSLLMTKYVLIAIML